MSAALLRKMRDMGLSMDQAIELMEVWEAGCVPPVPAIDVAAERRRANDRERKRNVRGMSAENLRKSEQDVSPTPPSEITPIPPLKGGTFPIENPPPEQPIEGQTGEAEPEQSPPRSARRKPSRPLPEDFPTAELIGAERDKALLAGIDLDASREAERFRNHALQTDRRCADWPAAWRNWTLKAREWAPKLQPIARPAGPEDPWPSRMLKWRRSGYWDSDWGPKPGRDGYLGPPAQDQAA